jgi:hypothetical protein
MNSEIFTILDKYLKKNLEKHYGGGGVLPKISKSEEESLTKHGYKLSKSPTSRRKALKKATKSRGTLAVLRRVNLIRNYSKSVPINYDKLSSDVDYLKKQYKKEKIKKSSRR